MIDDCRSERIRKCSNVRQGSDSHSICVVFTNALAGNFHYEDNLDSMHSAVIINPPYPVIK